jgi:guanylate kinase
MAKCTSKDEISIFLVPPSIEELERRIRGRNTESEEIIQERLNKARHEMIHKDLYDYIVVNSSRTEASEEIIKIIKDHLH